MTLIYFTLFPSAEQVNFLNFLTEIFAVLCLLQFWRGCCRYGGHQTGSSGVIWLEAPPSRHPCSTCDSPLQNPCLLLMFFQISGCIRCIFCCVSRAAVWNCKYTNVHHSVNYPLKQLSKFISVFCRDIQVFISIKNNHSMFYTSHTETQQWTWV